MLSMVLTDRLGRTEKREMRCLWLIFLKKIKKWGEIYNFFTAMAVSASETIDVHRWKIRIWTEIIFQKVQKTEMFFVK